MRAHLELLVGGLLIGTGLIFSAAAQARPIQYEFSGVVDQVQYEGGSLDVDSVFPLGLSFLGSFTYNADALQNPGNTNVFENIMTFDVQIGSTRFYHLGDFTPAYLYKSGPRVGTDSEFNAFDEVPSFQGALLPPDIYWLEDIRLVIAGNVMHWTEENSLPAQLDLSQFTGGAFSGQFYGHGYKESLAFRAGLTSIQEVPEPGALALLTAGVAGVLFGVRRRIVRRESLTVASR